jgi:hypothetical protein
MKSEIFSAHIEWILVKIQNESRDLLKTQFQLERKIQKQPM